MSSSRMRVACVLATIGLTAGLIGPAHAKDVPFKTLGTDPQLDAPVGGDITQLDAGVVGSNLAIRFHLSAMFPVQGTYPEAGIEWAFDTGGKSFVAEGHPENGGAFAYNLFELAGASLREVGTIDGEVDWAAATMTIYVPLKTIGARKGSRISGHGASGTEDVDIHLHANAASRVLDTMATTDDLVVR